jgi:hypothetical protein
MQIGKMEGRKRTMMGRLPQRDFGGGGRRRCRARKIGAVCGGHRCLRSGGGGDPERPEEARRVDLAAESIQGEEKTWCSCEASECLAAAASRGEGWRREKRRSEGEGGAAAVSRR